MKILSCLEKARESKRKQEKARGSKRKQEEARERQIRKAGGIRHVQCGKEFVILSLSLLWQDEFT